MSTALQKALSGRVSGKNAGLVNKLAQRVKTMTAAKTRDAENGKVLATTLRLEAESSGTLAVAAGAEGYFGTDKMFVGGVDVRAPIGLALMSLGTWMNSRRQAYGRDVYAVGQGAAHASLAGFAVRKGAAMAAKRAGTPATTTTPPTPNQVPALAGDLDGEIGDFVREVTLTEPGLSPARRI